jgi:hypothetical protein
MKKLIFELFLVSFLSTKMNINVFYEIPIIEWSDINTKEEAAYRECYDSSVRPACIVKSVAQILEIIKNSCLQQHKGIYIGIENNPTQHKQMNIFIDKIQEFLALNYPHYCLQENTFLAMKSRVWFSRLAIEL